VQIATSEVMAIIETRVRADRDAKLLCKEDGLAHDRAITSM
jgi:hypothetical protein